MSRRDSPSSSRAGPSLAATSSSLSSVPSSSSSRHAHADVHDRGVDRAREHDRDRIREPSSSSSSRWRRDDYDSRRAYGSSSSRYPSSTYDYYRSAPPPRSWRDGPSGSGSGRDSRDGGSHWKSRDDDRARHYPGARPPPSSSRVAYAPLPSHRQSQRMPSGGRDGRRDRDTRDADAAEEEREEDEAPRIDWSDVESRARANGLVVPSDIVEEYKRQGHFDLLRRQVLSAFQSPASSAKRDTQSAIGDLLVAYFAQHPHEAAKIAKMSDVRLQNSECLRILDMHQGPTEATTGPEIMRKLIDQLQEDADGQEHEEGFRGILGLKGRLGQSIAGEVEHLLRDEIKDGERRVAVDERVDGYDGDGSAKAAKADGDDDRGAETGKTGDDTGTGTKDEAAVTADVDDKMDIDTEKPTSTGETAVSASENTSVPAAT